MQFRYTPTPGTIWRLPTGVLWESTSQASHWLPVSVRRACERRDLALEGLWVAALGKTTGRTCSTCCPCHRGKVPDKLRNPLTFDPDISLCRYLNYTSVWDLHVSVGLYNRCFFPFLNHDEQIRLFVENSFFEVKLGRASNPWQSYKTDKLRLPTFPDLFSSCLSISASLSFLATRPSPLLSPGIPSKEVYSWTHSGEVLPGHSASKESFILKGDRSHEQGNG